MCITYLSRDSRRNLICKNLGLVPLTHKSCGIFVASWGFAHSIGNYQSGIPQFFVSERKEHKWRGAVK